MEGINNTGFQRAQNLLNKADVNRDGQVSAQELKNVDTTGDVKGSATKAKLEQNFGQISKGDGAISWQDLQQNGDKFAKGGAKALPNGAVQTTLPNGAQRTTYKDRVTMDVTQTPQGPVTTTTRPGKNGKGASIITNYPDGSIKTQGPDGKVNITRPENIKKVGPEEAAGGKAEPAPAGTAKKQPGKGGGIKGLFSKAKKLMGGRAKKVTGGGGGKGGGGAIMGMLKNIKL